jgi:hypothetical protein
MKNENPLSAILTSVANEEEPHAKTPRRKDKSSVFALRLGVFA